MGRHWPLLTSYPLKLVHSHLVLSPSGSTYFKFSALPVVFHDSLHGSLAKHVVVQHTVYSSSSMSILTRGILGRWTFRVLHTFLERIHRSNGFKWQTCLVYTFHPCQIGFISLVIGTAEKDIYTTFYLYVIIHIYIYILHYINIYIYTHFVCIRI